MNMKRLLSLVAFFATLQASAQQVNPVPDYVFANRMSAGRNTVTDTAAYFSIGPRYGATRGMMPPMVVDTASFSANKRNGLLIFSVQKNKFLYWDSVGVKWAEMAGTGGTAISSGDTASMLLPYVRHAGYGLIKSGQSVLVDSAAIATRARVQKAIDSLGAVKQNILTNPITGTGTTNTVVKFTSSTTVGNSGITEDGAKILYSGNLGLGTISSPNGKLDIGVVAGSGSVSATYSSTAWDDVASNGTKFAFRQRFASYDVGNITMQRDGAESRGILSFNLTTDWASAAPVEVFRITSAKEFFINTTTDAGDYKLQVAGNIYSTQGGILAATSGQIGIGTTPSYKLDVNGFARINSNVYLSTNASTFTRVGSLDDLGLGQFAVVGDGGTGLHIGIYNPSTSNGARIIMNDNTNGAEIRTIPGTSMTFRTNGNERARVTSAGEFIIDASGTDAGDYKLQVVGNVYTTGSLTTGAPSGGSIKPWKIGEAATVSPTSPNRTIRVEIDGTVYYLHAKTTND